MGKASKRLKRVDSEDESASDDEIETKFAFNKRWKQTDDKSGSGLDAESDDSEGSGTEEEDEEDEGSDAEKEEDGGSEAEEAEYWRKDVEMEELEKEYLNLRNEEQNLLKNLTRHKDEDALKGQAVKNQKALWASLWSSYSYCRKHLQVQIDYQRNPLGLHFVVQIQQ